MFVHQGMGERDENVTTVAASVTATASVRVPRTEIVRIVDGAEGSGRRTVGHLPLSRHDDRWLIQLRISGQAARGSFLSVVGSTRIQVKHHNPTVPVRSDSHLKRSCGRDWPFRPATPTSRPYRARASLPIPKVTHRSIRSTSRSGNSPAPYFSCGYHQVTKHVALRDEPGPHTARPLNR